MVLEIKHDKKYHFTLTTAHYQMKKTGYFSVGPRAPWSYQCEKYSLKWEYDENQCQHKSKCNYHKAEFKLKCTKTG